jgi:hypothetical protein
MVKQEFGNEGKKVILEASPRFAASIFGENHATLVRFSLHAFVRPARSRSVREPGIG